MTKLQRSVFRVVAVHTMQGLWYRAASSGERVTLASLYRAGALVRRAWRGREGELNAANEYKLSDDALDALALSLPDPQSERCSTCGKYRAVHHDGALCSEQNHDH